MGEGNKKWYVLRAAGGKEKKAKEYLEKEIERYGLQDLVSQVLVPTEKVYKIRDGKRYSSERLFYPGYVLIEAELTGELQYIIRNEVPHMSGFLTEKREVSRSNGKVQEERIPIPLRDSEVKRILGEHDEAADSEGETIVDYAVGLAQKTLVENVDTSPAARASLVDAFGKFGVTKIMLEAYIQRKMDAITADQIVNLRGVYASLRDGIATVTDFFDPEAKPIGEPEQTTPAAEKKTAARKPAAKPQQKAEPAPEPQPEPQPEPTVTSEGEILEDAGASAAFDNAAGPEEFDDDEDLY